MKQAFKHLKLRTPAPINKMYSRVSFTTFSSKRAKVSNQVCLLKNNKIESLRLTLNGKIGTNGGRSFIKVGASWKQF